MTDTDHQHPMPNQNAATLPPTVFLWRAAGCPTPLGPDLLPVKPVRGEVEAEQIHCTACGGMGARFELDQAISDSFTTVKNASRAWPHGGTAICAACLWCCRAIVLRCALFFARVEDERAGGGVWFVPIRPIPDMPGTRPDPLEALLNPPEPPFVACFPLYGIEHGGEANAERGLLGEPPTAEERTAVDAMVAEAVAALGPFVGASSAKEREKAVRLFLTTGAASWATSEHAKKAAEIASRLSDPWRGKPWWHWAVNPLIKLQSKHVAIYARVATSRTRYPLQIDDTGDIVVDVPLWRELRTVAEGLLLELRNGGVGSTDARAALSDLRIPRGCPRHLAATWRERTAPLERHVAAPWWRSLFVELLPMPELVKTEKGPKR